MGSYSNYEKLATRISERKKQNNRLQRLPNTKPANKVVAQMTNSGYGVIGEKIMIIMRKFIVKKNECGILFKDGDFQKTNQC